MRSLSNHRRKMTGRAINPTAYLVFGLPAVTAFTIVSAIRLGGESRFPEYISAVPSAALLAAAAYAPLPDVFLRLSAAICPHGVAMPPGSMMMTSMPKGFVSNRRQSENPSKAC